MTTDIEVLQLYKTAYEKKFKIINENMLALQKVINEKLTQSNSNNSYEQREPSNANKIMAKWEKLEEKTNEMNKELERLRNKKNKTSDDLKRIKELSRE